MSFNSGIRFLAFILLFATLLPAQTGAPAQVRTAVGTSAAVSVKVLAGAPRRGYAVALQKAFMSKAPSDDFCNPSPQVTSFLNTDAKAWLYASITSGAAGDVPKVEWLRPDGQIHHTTQFNPQSKAGDLCFDDDLPIAGTPVAAALGTWTVRGLWNGSPLFTLTFTLVSATCTYSISPASGTFGASGGSGAVSVTAGAGCSWTAASSANWITITSGASGSGGGTAGYTVAVNTGSTSRTGTLTVAGQTHTVTQAGVAPSGPPQLSTGGVTNAADYSRDFAPGTIVSIFGTNLAPTAAGASRLPLPTTLEATSVEVIDGAATLNAPLFYVSPAQINAQLPFSLNGSSVRVRVRNAAGVSSTDTITILPRAPRLFTKTMDGKGEAVVLHANYSVVSAASPAKPGEVVILYLTGLGAVDPAIAAGSAGGDGSEAAPLNLVTEGVSVTVGGRPARVYFAGLAPYFAGLYQVNFQMPSEMLGGAGAVVVSSGGHDSQANATVTSAANWQAIGSGSIGSGGGTVAAAGISVTAPAGAFATATTLTLLRKPTPPASALDAYRSSEFFALSGLPDTINAPMTLKLDISRPGPSGGDTLVMLQDVSGVASGPIFLPATVQGNQLVATIPAASATSTLAAFHPDDPPPSSAPDAGPPLWMIAGMKSSGHVTNGTSNFLVYYFDATRDTAVSLMGSLDSAYSKLGALGLDWSKRPTPPMPFQANLFPFTGKDAEATGLTTATLWGRQWQQLDFNSTLTTDVTERWTTAGHEVFHLWQNLNDPRTWYQVVKFSSSWLWMLEASSTWFERLMGPGNDTTFVPANAKKFLNFLSNHGLEYPPGDRGTVQDHGYGAAMFLEHISRQKGDKAVAEVIKLMAQGEGLLPPQPKYLPVEALNSAVGDVGVAWLQFCRNYMTGSVYSGFPAPADVSGLATGNRARFAKETDAAVTFTWNAPDLSARVYSVAFDLLHQWPANTKLSISLTDPGGQAEAIIYKAGAGFRVWSSAGTVRAAAWEYPDVAELVKNRVSLIIMVANGRAVKPYSGTTPITLKVQVGSASVVTPFKYVAAKFCGDQTWKNILGKVLPKEPKCLDSGNEGGVGRYKFSPVPLTWSGNTFSVSVSTGGQPQTFPADPYTKYLCEQTISGEVDAAKGRLVRLVVKAWYSSDTQWSDGRFNSCQYTSEMTVVDLPLSLSSSIWDRYLLEGSQVKDHISGIKASERCTSNWGKGTEESGLEYIDTDWTSTQSFQSTPQLTVQFGW